MPECTEVRRLFSGIVGSMKSYLGRPKVIGHHSVHPPFTARYAEVSETHILVHVSPPISAATVKSLNFLFNSSIFEVSEIDNHLGCRGVDNAK